MNEFFTLLQMDIDEPLIDKHWFHTVQQTSQWVKVKHFNLFFKQMEPWWKFIKSSFSPVTLGVSAIFTISPTPSFHRSSLRPRSPLYIWLLRLQLLSYKSHVISTVFFQIYSWSPHWMWKYRKRSFPCKQSPADHHLLLFQISLEDASKRFHFHLLTVLQHHHHHVHIHPEGFHGNDAVRNVPHSYSISPFHGASCLVSPYIYSSCLPSFRTIFILAVERCCCVIRPGCRTTQVLYPKQVQRVWYQDDLHILQHKPNEIMFIMDFTHCSSACDDDCKRVWIRSVFARWLGALNLTWNRPSRN